MEIGNTRFWFSWELRLVFMIVCRIAELVPPFSKPRFI